MTKQRKSSLRLIACLLLAACSVPAAGSDWNLVTDPGFEHETAADAAGWRLFGESRFSDKHARSGEQSMFNFGFSRTVPFQPFLVGTVSGSYQEFPATPGSRWRLTGFGLTPAALQGTPAFGIVQISFFDEDGRDIGTVETVGRTTAKAKTSNEINAATPPGEWIFLDTGIATAPDRAASVQAFTLYVDYSDSNTSQGVYFDDLSLCQIEEDSEQGQCKSNPGG